MKIEVIEDISIWILPYWPVFVSPVTLTWLNLKHVSSMKLLISEARKRMWWRVISQSGLHNTNNPFHRHCHPVSPPVGVCPCDVKQRRSAEQRERGEAGSWACHEGVQRRPSCGSCHSGFKDPLSLVWLQWISSQWDFTLWLYGYMCRYKDWSHK